MAKNFVVVIRKDSITGPVVAVSKTLTLAAGSGTVAASDFLDNSLNGTIVVNNNIGYFTKIASQATVPTITNIVISPINAIESTANVINITYSVSDVVGRVIYWKITGIASTSTSDFIGDTVGFAYTQVGLRTNIQASVVVNNDGISETREQFYIDFTLDPALTEGNYFYRAGPYSIQDRPNSIEAYSVTTGQAISSYVTNSGNLNITVNGIRDSNVTVTGSGSAVNSFGGSSTYSFTVPSTGTYSFTNLNPAAGTYTYTVAYEQGVPTTATKTITVTSS